MKKIIFSMVIMLAMSFNASAKIVAVLDFDTDDSELFNQMPIMTDIFRAEMINTDAFSVVDRKHTQEVIDELSVQMSEITSDNDVKSIGEMLNADYIVIGHVQPLLNDPETHVFVTTHEEPIEMGFFAGLFAKKKTRTVTDYNTYTTQEKRINVVVQMINVETAKVVSSGRLDLDEWSDYSKYCPILAKRLVQQSGLKSRLTTVEPDMFYGTWEGELVSGNSVDTYTFSFEDNNIATVTLLSTDRNGNAAVSSGKGRYKYSKDDGVFVITINLLRGDVKHVKKITWKTMVKQGGDMFTVVAPVTSYGGATKKTVDFYKVQE